jgi:hypothetical protein
MVTKKIDEYTITLTCDGLAVTKVQADALVESATKLALLHDDDFAAQLAVMAEDVLRYKPGTLAVEITRKPQVKGLPHVTATIRSK